MTSKAGSMFCHNDLRFNQQEQDAVEEVEMQANRVINLDELEYPVTGKTYENCEFITSASQAVIQLEGVGSMFVYNYLGFDHGADPRVAGMSTDKIFVSCEFNGNRFRNIYVNT